MYFTNHHHPLLLAGNRIDPICTFFVASYATIQAPSFVTPSLRKKWSSHWIEPERYLRRPLQSPQAVVRCSRSRYHRRGDMGCIDLRWQSVSHKVENKPQFFPTRGAEETKGSVATSFIEMWGTCLRWFGCHDAAWKGMQPKDKLPMGAFDGPTRTAFSV